CPRVVVPVACHSPGAGTFVVPPTVTRSAVPSPVRSWSAWAVAGGGALKTIAAVSPTLPPADRLPAGRPVVEPVRGDRGVRLPGRRRRDRGRLAVELVQVAGRGDSGRRWADRHRGELPDRGGTRL